MTDSGDSKATFLSIPWCRTLLSAPDLRIRVPSSRNPKCSTEDSLFAQTLRTPNTISAALTFYPRPDPSASRIPAVNVFFKIGDALNGYPEILHGGIVASILDEGMGVLLNEDADREHMKKVALGHADGETHEGIGAFTRELKIRYEAPVRTPGVAIVRAEFLKKRGEGRG
ncbi:hypothetical protein H2203_000120 [Taxawa tesnikishii (nom. ined.)]|nr:hypothetical protein H2203_000120 [Dothideales sp. JES 119]